MSCFEGKLHEYPNISIDRFDGDNLNSTVFFLSHCHGDHMVGLDQSEFEIKLQSTFLYCHKITSRLLKALPDYAALSDRIVEKQVNQSFQLHVPGTHDVKEYQVKVTLISAGHCPGSVMFLFEGENGVVLYTGDFRLKKGACPNIGPFHETYSIEKEFSNVKQCPKEFVSVYVDSTFCISEVNAFTTRITCKKTIFNLVGEWLAKHKSNLVHISTKTHYGYEFLMIELSKHFQTKVHVTEKQYDSYRFVPNEIQKYLTTDGNSTCIHMCKVDTVFGNKKALLAPKKPRLNSDVSLYCSLMDNKDSHVLTISPTALYFIKQTKFKPIHWENERWVRVFYSSHSSKDEVHDFLSYLRPRNIYPNVVPVNMGTLEDVRSTLRHLECNKNDSAKGDKCQLTVNVDELKEFIVEERKASCEDEIVSSEFFSSEDVY